METFIKEFDELSLRELYDILRLRGDVFVVEQKSANTEIDGEDFTALHVYIKDGDRLEAYARILPKDETRDHVKIGRVISRQRRTGMGTRVMEVAIKAAQERFGADIIYLEAQTYIKDFYERLGFVQIGEEFIEADILHIPMILDLNQTQS